MSESILQIEKLFSAILDAEYRFLLIEPLMFYGLITGVILLLVGFFLKSSKLQSTALVTVGVAALLHMPYNEARQAAQPRMEQVYKVQAPARMKGFNENTREWQTKTWQFKLLLLVAGATFLIGVDRNRYGLGGAIITTILALTTAKNAMWLHYQDAIAFHPNLKVHEAPIDQRRGTLLAAPPRAVPVDRESSTSPGQAHTRSIETAGRPAASSATPQPTAHRIPEPAAPAPPRPRVVKPLSSP